MMKNLYAFLAISLSFSCIAFSNTFERIKSQKVAVALGKISLHADTAFHTQTNTVLDDGELLDILQQSKAMHLDKDENQQFRWYKVRTSAKQIGWVFGDAIAVFSKKNTIDTLLQAQFLKKWKLSATFGESISWLAAVEGIEMKSTTDKSRRSYKEQYLIFSNAAGKSISLALTVSGVEGLQQLKSFEIRDITGDDDPEITIEKGITVVGTFESRYAEIYRMSSAGFNKVFEESLTLTDSEQTLSPAQYKMLQIEKQLIRISYVDFRSCQDKRIIAPAAISKSEKKKCIDYVTSTYAWDPSSASFSLIYPESRKPLKGFSKGRYYLRTSPEMMAEKKAKLEPSDPIIALFVVSDFEKNVDKNIPIWLYIETNSGQSGYIPAFRIYFEVTEHADILNNYFSNPPGNGIQTRSNGKFILFPENGKTK